MREWTERHIRELVRAEYKKMKDDDGPGDITIDESVHHIDLSYFMPDSNTGGLSVGGLILKNWYFYPDRAGDKTIMRVECPVYSPGALMYQIEPNVYSYQGYSIIGIIMTPAIIQPPYYSHPIYYAREHYNDLSRSGVPEFQNNHNSGTVLWKWTPYNASGALWESPFVRCRNEQGQIADFGCGVIDAGGASKAFNTETLEGMRLGIIVPRQDGPTDWSNYDWNYKDYFYYPVPMAGATATHTICFIYKREYVRLV